MNAQQLKNAILQEAIEGRLVPQDPSDEPASVLLQRIRKEKERLVKEGKLKKKDLEVKPISEEEKPFEIPESWEWCRINDIIFPPKYGTSNKSLPQGDVPVLRMGNIQNGEIVFDKLVYSNSQTDNENYNLIKGDLLFNRTNSAELVGKTGIYRGQQKAIFAGYLILLRPINICSDYLNFVLGSSYARSYCKEVKTIGVQQCNINAEKISTFVIPLPPLAEQHRIVAKIEELLPKVEEYGKAQEALDKLNAELPEQLRKSILQEAISGRIVPQDPNDEPASILLDRIRQEKQKLVKEGKLKKKDLEEKPISEDEKPFEIPESWEWCSFGNVIFLLSGRDLTPQEYSDNKNGIPYITGASNFDGDSLIINRWTTKPITISKYGDLLITCKGTIGTMAFNLIGDIHIARQVMSISPYLIDIKYIKFVLMRIVYELDKKAKSIIPGISREDILNALFPLPPLAEQHRIVAKLEQLLGEIDKLKVK